MTVIKKFTDLQDGNHVYNVGDVYPREGYTPSEERIAELASDKNRQGTPLIEVPASAEVDAEETVEESKEVEELEEPKEVVEKPRKRKQAD
jgi:hypothetical protein